MTTTELAHFDSAPPPPPPPSHPPVPPPPPGRGWTPARTIGVVASSILTAIGVVLLIAGGALAWANTSQRDSDGYFRTHTEPIRSQEFAITSDVLDLGDDVRPGQWGSTIGDFVKVRLRAEAADPSTPIFVGVARSSDVDAYLANVGHDVVVNFDTDPFAVDYDSVSGNRQPARPADQSFWVVSNAGTGRQDVDWEPTGGQWTVVVMNADAHQHVSASMDVGIDVHHLGVIAGTMIGFGVVATIGGIVLIVVTTRRRPRPASITHF